LGLPYVKTYTTLSHINDVVLTNHAGLLMIVSISIVADWSKRHRINLKVSTLISCE